MIPLTVIRKPAPARGRPPIGGTVLETPEGDRFVAVRCACSHGEDAGRTGSPRVEVWVAFAEADFAPLVIRGSGRSGVPMEWAGLEGWHEVGEIMREDVLTALRRATHSPSLLDIWSGGPDRPQTIWDRRVLLPDDARFPRAKYPLRDGLRNLLARRDTCPDEEVWAVDALILNLAPRTD